MDTIGLHIDYLLLHHDCVTLPGVGSLLVHRAPASYDETSAVWTAPMREVSFNAAITRTDGLLARSVQRREGLEAAPAARRVEDAMAGLRRSLSAGHDVALGHAGLLSLNGHGALEFEPSVSPVQAWFPAVVAPRIEQASSVARRMERDLRRRSVWTRVGRVAAAVALLFVLGWVVADNIRFAAEDQYASITPVSRHDNLIEQPGEASAPIIWHMHHHADAVVEVEPKPVMAENADPQGYYLIVASLANMREANEFISRFPGRDLHVLNTGGRYRVYVQKAQDANSLYAAARSAEIAKDFPQSWVYKH